MRLGVPREPDPHERRVALVPPTVKRLVGAGHEVQIERGAGTDASFSDKEYAAAGAAIVESRAALLGAANAVLTVQRLSDGDLERVAPGGVVIGLCQPASAGEFLTRAAAREITVLAMELVPRITRAQAMDVLSSQATVAGYQAVLLGASRLARLLPMLTTAAGTISPRRALIPGAGGSAAALPRAQQARVLAAIANPLPDRALLIATAQIPGKPAPKLITAEM